MSINFMLFLHICYFNYVWFYINIEIKTIGLNFKMCDEGVSIDDDCIWNEKGIMVATIGFEPTTTTMSR